MSHAKAPINQTRTKNILEIERIMDQDDRKTKLVGPNTGHRRPYVAVTLLDRAQMQE